MVSPRRGVDWFESVDELGAEERISVTLISAREVAGLTRLLEMGAEG